MIPQKVIDYLHEYINQEIYVQIAVIKGKEKITTRSAINKYFSSNHFRYLFEGRPYDDFINSLRDKCLVKIKNSPLLKKKVDDEIIIELQKKINSLSSKELENTFWEIETGEFLSGDQIKELENNRDNLINKLDISDKDKCYKVIMDICKNYEEICQKKYPEAPLVLKVLN